MPERLKEQAVRAWLKERSGWKKAGETLQKEYRFPSFRDAIVFVNRVASLADDNHHHPDIDVRYDRVRLTLSTHDAGGITEKDLDLAEKIDFATSAR